MKVPCGVEGDSVDYHTRRVGTPADVADPNLASRPATSGEHKLKNFSTVSVCIPIRAVKITCSIENQLTESRTGAATVIGSGEQHWVTRTVGLTPGSIMSR